MRGLIPRQMFDVAIQAAIGARSLRRVGEGYARTLPAKCHGGDIPAEAAARKAGWQEADEGMGSAVPKAFLAIYSRREMKRTDNNRP
jgi:GTP-binding protein LepA